MKSLFALILFASVAQAQTPPSNVYGLDFLANNAQPVSGLGRARIRYNSGTNVFEQSVNGAAYVTLGAGTLSSTYTNGSNAAAQTLLINAGNGGPVIFEANGAGTGSLVQSLTSGSVVLFNILDNGTNVIRSGVPDGATAIGHTIDTINTLVTSGERLTSIQNGSVEFFGFSGNGSSGGPFGTIASRPTLFGDGPNPFITLSNAGGSAFGYNNNFWGANTAIAGLEMYGGGIRYWEMQNTGEFRPSTDLTPALGDATHRANGVFTNSVNGGAAALSVTTNTGGIVNVLSPAGTFFVKVDDATVGVRLGTTNTQLNVPSNAQMQLSSGGTGSGGMFLFTSSLTNQSANGNSFMKMNPGLFTGYFWMTSGTTTFGCSVAEDLTSSGTTNNGDAACWTGSDGKTVSTCGAVSNSTLVAGVVIVGGANGTTIQVCKHGRVIANAEALLSTGAVLGTSGSTAGRLTNGGPGAGAVVGHAADATNGNGEGANKIYVDVNL